MPRSVEDHDSQNPLADDVADETPSTHTSGGFAGRKATMSPILKLIARIENSASADVALKDIRILAKSHDPEAISALAGLLDDDGRVGREAVRALRRFGRAAEATLMRCLASTNDTIQAHARELLAALGDTHAPEIEEVPPIAPTHDNGDRERPDCTGLADPKVIHAIRATLYARGMARGELDDGVADVQVKALELLVTRDAPRDLEEWKKLCNKIAVDCAIDALRKKARRARYEDDLCEDPDAHAADLHREKERDPVDMERLLAIIEEQLRAARIPEISFTILDGEAVGVSHEEMARTSVSSSSECGESSVSAAGSAGSKSCSPRLCVS